MRKKTPAFDVVFCGFAKWGTIKEVVMSIFYKSMRVNLFLVFFMFSFDTRSADLSLISMEAVPWAYFDERSKTYEGFFPDFVRELERRTGHSIKITLTPYARVNRELQTARQDCTILISEKERSEIATLGELVFNIPLGVVARKGIDLDKYEDLYGLTISVLRSLKITDRFTNDSNLKKEFDKSYKTGLKKILHGRLDAIAGTIPTIKLLAKNEGVSDLLGEPLQLSLEPIYLQCSKRSKNIRYMSDLNLAIKLIRDDLVLDRIIKNHYW
ncbi:MAG: polar amino acid transport system substrate-binding protein [Enterobacterales bacterium]|jgi:polar amino acid transport system substrate-binding protein